MTESYQEIFRQQTGPLEPLPTGESPVLERLPEVRAVLFDIYGTLVISVSGDVGTAQRTAPAAAFTSALEAVGIRFDAAGQVGIDALLETIKQDHARRGAAGVDFPEVDITDIWQRTLAQLRSAGMLGAVPAALDYAELAVQYEARVNPAWPMPGALACLEQLRSAGLRLGVISNAQFYTRELFPALFGQTLDALGFEPHLQFFSYRLGEAKPGRTMYRLAAEKLAEEGIASRQVVYVGNDMLNDIWPASQTGFRTALFAGDARSLRRRESDPRTAGLVPDLVLTHLEQLPACVVEQ